MVELVHDERQGAWTGLGRGGVAEEINVADIIDRAGDGIALGVRCPEVGEILLLLFSASLSYLGVLGDNPFLGSCRTKGQCAEAPMKRHIAEDAEAAEARREKQKQDLPYFRTPAPRMASSAFLARATLARMSLADFVQMKGFGAALWFAM
jgi:hypothetical protein